ncbi:acyl carrier protein [Streptomyces iconiensis]|uniref:Acyl carrier protein n=1 Tax=Streptomyces iconiensis TaxID=1384038 RepID=A0ABT6ZSI9_9ACTN|nr:acyl carrier protein [Streptomyces iconiensis]MDJ1132031.1 acyl carrier protein [Streptomyces iconiensis]
MSIQNQIQAQAQNQPKTQTQTQMQTQTRTQAQPWTQAQPGADATVRELSQEVLATVRGKFEAPQESTALTPYEDMEFDSLVLLELAVHLSKEYGVEVTDAEILDASDVARTAALLVGKDARPHG